MTDGPTNRVLYALAWLLGCLTRERPRGYSPRHPVRLADLAPPKNLDRARLSRPMRTSTQLEPRQSGCPHPDHRAEGNTEQ